MSDLIDKQESSSCDYENDLISCTAANDDLISRQTAIKAFKKELTVGELKGNYVTICSAIGYKGAKQILESLPPAPRKTGRWIFGHTLGHSWMKCSECLVSQDGQTACFSYCPNCGAKMEGE